MNETNEENNAKESFKSLSDSDFLAFGVHQVAYIKPVKSGNVQAFAVCSADGKPMIVLEDKGAAIATILHNNLEPVTLQ